MKKILLVITFSAFVLVSRTQPVLNEEYSDIITGHNEQPVKLIYFLGNINENRLLLKWNVADNESANLFEVEKSYDEKNYTIGGLIFSSEKNGNETYFFSDILRGGEKMFYRLKMIDKNQRVKYSKALSFQSVSSPGKNYLAINRSPVISLSIK